MKSTAAHIYWSGLILMIFTMPFTLKASNIAIGYLGFGWLLLILTRQIGFRASLSKEAYFSIGLYLLGVLSLLWTTNLSYGMKQLEYQASFIGLPIMLSGVTILPKSKLAQLTRLFVVIMLIACIVALAGSVIYYIENGTYIRVHPFNKVEENVFTYHAFSEQIGISALYLGYYLSLAILILIWIFFSRYSQLNLLRKVFLILTALFFLFCLILVYSLSAILGLIVSSIIMAGVLISQRQISRTRGILIGAGISVVAVASLILIESKVGIGATFFSYNFADVPPDGNWNAVNLRVAKWDVGFQFIRDHFLLGSGIGDLYDELLPYYLKNHFTFAYVERFNPHNEFIHTFCALGVVGIALLLSLFTRPLINSFRKRDALFTAFISLFLFVSLFESTLHRNKGIVFFVFFLFLFNYFSLSKSPNGSGEN